MNTHTFLKYQVLPALKGIDTIVAEFESALKKEFLFEHRALFPESDKFDNENPDAPRTHYRYSLNSTLGFQVVTSVGCGRNNSTWDASNWSTKNFTEEQAALVIAFDLKNKVKVFKQDLVANNAVVQKAAKSNIVHSAKYTRLMARVSRFEDKHEVFCSFSDYFDSFDDDEEADQEIDEMVDKTGFYSKEFLQNLESKIDSWECSGVDEG